jgi:hypothetical protein
MSGGGGTTTTQNNSPPQQYLDAYSQVMARAQQVASQPYTPYPGTPDSLLAGFTPMQQQGFAGIQNAQGAGQPFLNQAAANFGQANAPLQPLIQPYVNQAQGLYGNLGNTNLTGQLQPWQGMAAQGFQQGSQPLTPTQFSAGQVAQYMSPYTQSVINATQGQFSQQNRMAANQLRGNAASQNALGSDRVGVAQGVLAGQQQMAQAPVIAGLYNQGYGQALQEFNQQQGVGLQAQQGSRALQQQAAQGYMGLGTQAAGTAGQQAALQGQAAQGIAALGQQELGAGQAQGWLAAQTGQGYQGLGAQAFNQGLTGSNALLTAGALQQQQNQQALNIPYEQWLAAQSYPYQQVGWLGNLAEGLGGSAGGTGSTTSPGPSAFSQVAGLGLGAISTAGAAGAFKGAWNNNGSPGWAQQGYNWATGANSGQQLYGSAADVGPFMGEMGSGAGQAIYNSADSVGPFLSEMASAAARGGRIKGFAGGGEVPDLSAGPLGAASTGPGTQNILIGDGGGGVPDVSGSVVPGANGMGAAPAAPGTEPYIMRDYGHTSTTTHPHDSIFGKIAKGIGTAAATYWGGPAGFQAAMALNENTTFDRGGAVPGGFAAGGMTDDIPGDLDVTTLGMGVPNLHHGFIPDATALSHGHISAPRPPAAAKPEDVGQEAQGWLQNLKKAGVFGDDTPGSWRGGRLPGFADGGDLDMIADDLTPPDLARIRRLPAGSTDPDTLPPDLPPPSRSSLFSGQQSKFTNRPVGAEFGDMLHSRGEYVGAPKNPYAEADPSLVGNDFSRPGWRVLSDQFHGRGAFSPPMETPYRGYDPEITGDTPLWRPAVRRIGEGASTAGSWISDTASDIGSGFVRFGRRFIPDGQSDTAGDGTETRAQLPPGTLDDPGYPSIAGGSPGTETRAQLPPGTLDDPGYPSIAGGSPGTRDRPHEPADKVNPGAAGSGQPAAGSGHPGAGVHHAGGPGGGGSSGPGGLGGPGGAGGLGGPPPPGTNPVTGRPDPYADLLTQTRALKEDKANPWLALATAGFTMAGGTSPFAGVNIGRGAAAGVQAYVSADRAAKDLAAKVDETRARLLETQAYHDVMGGAAQTRAQAATMSASSRAYLNAYKMAHPSMSMAQLFDNVARQGVADGVYPSYVEGIESLKGISLGYDRLGETTRHHGVTERQGEDRLAQQREAIMNTQEYRDELTKLRQQGMSDANARAVLNGAVTLKSRDFEGAYSGPNGLAKAREDAQRQDHQIRGEAAAQPATPQQPPITPEQRARDFADAKAAVDGGFSREEAATRLIKRGYSREEAADATRG